MMKRRKEREKGSCGRFCSVDTMVAWRDSQTVIVTCTARMHVRMRRFF